MELAESQPVPDEIAAVGGVGNQGAEGGHRPHRAMHGRPLASPGRGNALAIEPVGDALEAQAFVDIPGEDSAHHFRPFRCAGDEAAAVTLGQVQAFAPRHLAEDIAVFVWGLDALTK